MPPPRAPPLAAVVDVNNLVTRDLIEVKLTNEKTHYFAVGFMSGTSLDGVDVAYIMTDGVDYVEPIAFRTYDYNDGLRARLRSCFGAYEKNANIAEIEDEMTRFHADILKSFMADIGQGNQQYELDIIGFHGQTVTHDPKRHFTWQLGDGELLRTLTQCDVVYDFRQADVAAGGQGAPLIPIYHSARLASLRRASFDTQKKPNFLAALNPLLRGAVAIVNIGGVSNISWVGEERDLEEEIIQNIPLLAFDCGPGNALMDDYIFTCLGKKFDKGGAHAARGRADEALILQWMSHEFFTSQPPKSLDRNAWNFVDVSSLSHEDALATLSEFSARSIACARRFLPTPPLMWLITGGGRLNSHLMKRLEALLQVPVKTVDDLGWNGDAIEAEGFAYMAVRRLLNLPISFPTTTCAPHPLCGGKISSHTFNLNKFGA